MQILLLYATYSSGTRSASEIVAEVLTAHGHTVRRKEIKDANPQDLSTQDLTILASPSWWNDNKDGQPHHHFLSFMKKCETSSGENKKFAVFGLGDSSYAHFCGAVDELVGFVTRLKGELIIEPLCIDSYYFAEEKNIDLLKNWVNKLSQTIGEVRM